MDMNNKIKLFKDLIVWQKSIDLCELIYIITQKFPKSELYGLTGQIRRCSVSIPSNIAEGFLRGHKAEYVQFLRIAYGSGAELETQLLIAHRIKYINNKEFEMVENLIVEIMKMLNSLINRLGISTKT